MNKNVKKAITLVIIALLILAIVWVVYEAIKLDSAEIKPTSDLPNENMGIDNIMNVFKENNETNETEQNVIANEIEEQEDEKENIVEEKKESSKNTQNNSEVVSGTSQTREEKAVELAKEFYKEKYGEPKNIYFEYNSVYKDGRYIVTAGKAGESNNKFFFVDLNTGLVTEK